MCLCRCCAARELSCFRSFAYIVLQLQLEVDDINLDDDDVVCIDADLNDGIPDIFEGKPVDVACLIGAGPVPFISPRTGSILREESFYSAAAAAAEAQLRCDAEAAAARQVQEKAAAAAKKVCGGSLFVIVYSVVLLVETL